MNAFFLMLFHPIKAFRDIKVSGKFSLMSFFVILLLMLINLILMIPVNEKIASITFSSLSLPENQIGVMEQVIHKMRYLQIAGSEIVNIIMFLFYALLLFLFIRVVKEKLFYKNALQLIIYSYFIITIGDLINTAIMYSRGLDAITNIYETSLIGLNLFTSIEHVGATLYAFLSYFTPFQLAFVILLSIGLKVFTEIKYAKALIITVIFWLIIILIPTLSVYFSELTVRKSGLI